ncbi:MAG: nucleotide exchange factor GrpE [Rickettsiales bacterium]|nr:nucleotide exchange factor GrpE [Rickettsiales bacterium]
MAQKKNDKKMQGKEAEVLLADQEKVTESLEKCQRQIEDLEKANQEFKEHALRAMAEVENIKKRTEKEITDIKKYALSSFIESLVPVIENLYRSTEHISDENVKDESVKKIIEGIEMTQAEFMKILEKQGVTRIMPKQGDDFNPNLHQAISMISGQGQKANSVQAVIQAGYLISERLIRPALVVVNQ